MLIDCLKKIKGFTPEEVEEMTSAYTSAVEGGASKYEASIEAVTGYHKGLVEQFKVIRPVRYKAPKKPPYTIPDEVVVEEEPVKEVVAKKPVEKRPVEKVATAPDVTTTVEKGATTQEPLRAIPSNPLDGIITKDGIDYERVQDVARRVEEGSAEIRYLNPEVERGRIAGGRRNVEASIILAANERASEESGSRTPPVKRQERILEDYAKQAGIWFDIKKFTGEQQGFIRKGQEAYVHRSADGKSVYKLVDYKGVNDRMTPLAFIDKRISLFNYLFPDTAYELTGFTRDSGGKFRFIVKQPFVQDVVYTLPVERAKFMDSKGFQMTSQYGESFATPLYYVGDLHEKNALKGTDGTIYVIDAVPDLDAALYQPFDVTTTVAKDASTQETPEPLRSVPDENFGQSDYTFKESDYRPSVVDWAKERFGDRVAPNGKPVYQNFIRWFGDSQVVNEKGEPLVVYHGTNADFDIHQSPVFLTAGYFAADPGLASHFAELKGRHRGGTARVNPAYLSLQNPLDLSNIRDGYQEVTPDQFFKQLPFPVAPNFQAQYKESQGDTEEPLFGHLGDKAITLLLKDQGYDGVIFNEGTPRQHKTSNTIESTRTYIAFEPTQIKSALGNTGNFSPEEGSILKKQPESRADLDELKTKYLDELAPDVKTEYKGENVVEINAEASEVIRTALAAVQDTKREAQAVVGSLFTEPQNAAGLIEAIDEIGIVLDENGIDTKQVKALVKNIEKASDKDGTVIFDGGGFKHEEDHYASWKGAARKELSVRYHNLKSLVSDKLFSTAFNGWVKLEGRNWKADNASPVQLGHAAEEMARYIADGDHARLGLTEREGDKLAVELGLRYAQARIEENPDLTVAQALATFDGTNTGQYIEAINNEATRQSNEGDVQSEGTGQDQGYKQSDTSDEAGDGEGVSGSETFTPGGPEKLSQSPTTMRGNVAAFEEVEDRTYLSTTNDERQEFANSILDKGITHARNWLDEQIKNGDNNAGATQAIGLTLMNHYAQNGGIDAMNEIAKKIITKGTDNAQAVQAMSMVSQFDPESAASYASLLKQRKTGKDLTDAERQKATDIATTLSETAKVEGIGAAVQQDLENYIKELTAENEAIKEALADKPSESKTDVANLKRQLTRWKNKALGLSDTAGRMTRTHQELLGRKSDILDRLRQKFPDAVLRMAVWRFDEPTKRPQIAKDAPGVFWHGSDNADMRGGTTGLHVGTHEAAKQALEARIGVPAEGEWDGTREYGKTLLMGKRRLDELAKQGIYKRSGYNTGALDEDYYPTDRPDDRATYSNGEPVPFDAVPIIEPVRIIGNMTNSAVYDLRGDWQANGLMRRALKKGNARSGFYYTNEGEDSGSVSAVVPDETYVERLWKDVGYELDGSTPLRSVPSNFDDSTRQDLIDYSALNILEGKSYADVIKHLNDVTKGVLNEAEVKSIHANAVMAIRGERPSTTMDEATRQKIKNRNEHVREAKKFQGSSKNPNLSRLEREIANIATDDRVRISAIIQARTPDLKTWNNLISEVYDLDKTETRELYRQGRELRDEAKKNLERLKRQNETELKLSEDDLARIKEERRVNNALASKARREADNFYNGLVRSRADVVADTIVNARRANLLTGIKTHFRNILGNTVFGVTEEVQRPVAWLADRGAGLVTGEKTVGGINAKSIINSFYNTVAKDEVFKNIDKETGIEAAKHILRYGDSQENMERMQHSESVLAEKFPGRPAKWIDNYINGVFRTLGAEDAIFKVYAFRRSLEEQATALAKTEGGNWKERRGDLLRHPTETMQIVASDFANFMTFQNDNILSNLFTKFKRLHPGVRTVAETIVPYDRTPTNIVMRVAEHLPIAGQVIAGKQLLDLRRGPDKNFRNRYRGAVQTDLMTSDEWNKLDENEKRKAIDDGIAKVWSREKQAKFARTVGRSSLGSSLFFTGFGLAALGLLTGSMGPEDDDKKETGEFFDRRSKGIENKSLLIPGVGRFVLPDDPASKTIGAGATFYEQMMMSKGDVVSKAWDAAGEVTKDAMFEQPLMGNVGQLYQTIKKGKYGEFAGQLLGGMVPTLASDVGEVLDDKARTTSGYKPRIPGTQQTTMDRLAQQGRGFRNSFLRRIPLVRQFADESKAVPSDIRGGILRRAARMIDPFNTRPATSYTPPEAKPGVDNYLNSPEFKKATTDDLVDVLMNEDMPASDRDKIKDALKKKAMNARKTKTLTQPEVDRINKVLPEFNITAREKKR